MKEYRCRKCSYYFYSEDCIPYCCACDCEDLEDVMENYIENESVESHHIHPKFMDNKKGLGQQYNIPKKKHHILHGKIMKWLWEEIREEDKGKAIINIIRKSKKEIGVE